MAFSTKVGSFDKKNGTGSQAVTGVGFTPKALMLWSARKTAFDVFTGEDYSYAIAFFDASTAAGRASEFGSAIGTPKTAVRQAAAFTMLDVFSGFPGSTTVVGEAGLTSFDADGFTLNWTTSDSSTPKILYLALGGSDVTNVKVGSFTPTTNAGAQPVTGVGFRPSGVLFLPGFHTTLPLTTNDVLHSSLGCGCSAKEQWALFCWSASGGGYGARYQRTDRCIAMASDTVTFSSGTQGFDPILSAEARFVSRDVDGFTLDWLHPTNGAKKIFYLAIKGGRYKAGNFLKLQGSQAQSIKGVPFQPSALLMASDGRHEDLVDRVLPVSENKWAVGAVDSAGTDASLAYHDMDGGGVAADGTIFFPNRASYMAGAAISKVITAPSGVLADVGWTSFDANGFTIQNANADSNRRQFLYLAMGAFLSAAACSGDGAGPSGSNPAADFPSTSGSQFAKPIVFGELQTDSGVKRYAYTAIADPSTYFGGYKEARILSIGPIRRILSDLTGAPSVATLSMTLDDTDRVVRGLIDSGTLENKRFDLYVVDDVDRLAANAPYRVGMFIVRRFQVPSDLTVTLELEDFHGAQVGEYEESTLYPQRVFGTAQFADIPADLIGVPEPIGYGNLSDESDGIEAVGVVPTYYTGQELVNGFVWDRYVVFGHAIKSIQSWFARDLDVEAATEHGHEHGHAGHAPTRTPMRVKMPAGTEGVDFLIPGNSGWVTHTGSSATYRDYGGRRYTVIFARGPRSDAAKSGQMPIVLNVCGLESTGDGTGTMIASLPRQIAHLYSNFIYQNYLTGTWPATPTVNGYARIRTSSFETVKTISEARISGGYKGAFILGGNQGQLSLAALQQLAAQNCDISLSTNRHGQLVASMEDTAAAAVIAYNDVNDIIDFDIELGWDDRANRLPYRFGQRYAPAVATVAAAEGDRITPTLTETATDSLGEDALANSAAITAHGLTRNAPLLDLAWLRDEAIVDDLVTRVLARLCGASPYRGPIYATFSVGLRGVILLLTNVELGDVITVTHYAGLTATGWTNKRCRVLAIEFQPDIFTFRLRVIAL